MAEETAGEKTFAPTAKRKLDAARKGDVLRSKEGTSAAAILFGAAALGGGNPGCKEERVFVRAQPEVKYSQFMEVMNKMQENGFFKVGLLNEDIE